MAFHRSSSDGFIQGKHCNHKFERLTISCRAPIYTMQGEKGGTFYFKRSFRLDISILLRDRRCEVFAAVAGE